MDVFARQRHLDRYAAAFRFGDFQIIFTGLVSKVRGLGPMCGYTQAPNEHKLFGFLTIRGYVLAQSIPVTWHPS